jgi:hypothetical protein
MPSFPRPQLLALLALAACLWGCLGGQSGDDGLGNDPGPPGDDFAEIATATEPCDGEASDGRSGTCTMRDGGWDCECGERSGNSDASLCPDALRERCGLEPVAPAAGCKGADEDAGACDR